MTANGSESSPGRSGLSFFHIEMIARRQEIKLAARSDDPAAVIDGHVALSDDLEFIAPDNDRSVFIQPQAEEFGMGLDDFDQVELAVPH